MKKTLLAGAAALAVTVAYAGAANAQCVWTGWNWNCAYAPPAQTYYQPPPPYYPYYPQPSAGTSNPEVTGYKPSWYPSQSGPRASGGAGY